MIHVARFTAFALLLTTFCCAQAQTVIDEFTEDQGPFVADPEIEVTDDPAIVLLGAGGVLGEVRIMLGFMSADAGTDSTTTVEAASGQWTCDIDFQPEGVGEGGACSITYDRGCGERFYDFSETTAFVMEVDDVSGPVFLDVQVFEGAEFDPAGEDDAGSYFGTLLPGSNVIPIHGFIPLTALGGDFFLDFGKISSLTFVLLNDPEVGSLDTSATISAITTDGPVEFIDGDLSQCAADDVVFEDGFEIPVRGPRSI